MKNTGTPQLIGTYANKVKEVDDIYPEHDRTSCSDTNLYNASCFMMSPRCNRCEALQYLQDRSAMFAETDDGKSIATLNNEALAACMVYLKEYWDTVQIGKVHVSRMEAILLNNKLHFDKEKFIKLAVPKFMNRGILFNVELKSGVQS